MPPPLRQRLKSPPPRPFEQPAAGPRPSPPPEPASAWTDAKVQAVLEGFRSFLANASKKHGVPPEEVLSLVKDHILDPD